MFLLSQDTSSNFLSRLVTNKYLRIPGSSSIEHVVEFGYSFDVHLNAFFPLLIILHMVQLIGLLCKYLLISLDCYVSAY